MQRLSWPRRSKKNKDNVKVTDRYLLRILLIWPKFHRHDRRWPLSIRTGKPGADCQHNPASSFCDSFLLPGVTLRGNLSLLRVLLLKTEQFA